MTSKYSVLLTEGARGESDPPAHRTVR
jgi:hypothetical protein